MATRRRIATPPVQAPEVAAAPPPAEVVPMASARYRRMSYADARAALVAVQAEGRSVDQTCDELNRPELVVAFYGWAHEHMYRVAAEELDDRRAWRRMVDSAERLAEQHFGGQHSEAARYVAWMLNREIARMRGGDGGRRVGWGLVCSAAVVTDYLVARRRNGSPSETPAQHSEPARAATAPEAAPPDATGLLFDRGDHVDLAETLVSMLRERAPTVFAEDEFRRYDARSGLWSAIARGELSQVVQGFAGAPVGTDEKSAPLKLRSGDVKGTIGLAADRVEAPGFFDGAPRGLAFSDCFVTVGEDGTIHRAGHSPDHRARLGYPFPFRADAECPKWLALLAGYFAGDADAEAKTRLLQEFGGAALLGVAPTYQRCLVLHGEGGTGKSTVTNVIEAAMPAGSTTAVAPQTWGQPYQRAKLAGRLLNVVGELPEQDIIEAESFKVMVTGETVDARQPYGRAFDFRPTAAHLFAANRLPGTSDQSSAFWRRMLVVQFTRPVQNAKRDIWRDVLAAERGAVVAWLLQGAARLRKRGDYQVPASSTAAVEEWRRDTDQVAGYVEERCELSDDQEHDSTAGALYGDYLAWAKANGHRPVSSNKFAERLAKLGHPRRRTASARYYPLALRTTAASLVRRRNAGGLQ